MMEAEIRGEIEMKTRRRVPVCLLFCLILIAGCATVPKNRTDQAALKADTKATIEKFKARDPSIQWFFDNSRGYAVFPSIGKGAWWVGGAYGRGVVYQDGDPVGWCKVTQGSIGLQFGGQAYSEIVFFQDEATVESFKASKMQLSAGLSAVALTAGAAGKAKYQSGVAVFVVPQGGLMVEAAVGGQQFDFQPM
jgi:lipid-binding SYLF domain-containing protein